MNLSMKREKRKQRDIILSGDLDSRQERKHRKEFEVNKKIWSFDKTWLLKKKSDSSRAHFLVIATAAKLYFDKVN